MTFSQTKRIDCVEEASLGTCCVFQKFKHLKTVWALMLLGDISGHWGLFRSGGTEGFFYEGLTSAPSGILQNSQ